MNRWLSAHGLGQVHRTLGRLLAFFVLLLAGSGLLLNHTSELNLAQIRLNIPWINALYGQKPSPCETAFSLGERWLSLCDGQLFLDSERLNAPTANHLYGALIQQDVLLIATEQLGLYTPQGERIDHLAYPSGRPPVRLGLLQGTALFDFSSESGLLQLNKALTALVPLHVPAGDTVNWCTPSTLPSALQEQIERTRPGAGVDLERLLLDVHSGRIAGKFGVYLMDTAAIGMVLLAISGWLIHRRRRSADRQSSSSKD
ncbi:MAG: hypothetical protein AB1766_04375 [Pseudomonadota bacterium]